MSLVLYWLSHFLFNTHLVSSTLSIYFIFRHSALLLDTAHIDVLWKHMVTEAVTTQESDQFYTWFEAVSGKKNVLAGKAVTRYVFEQKLAKLDFAGITYVDSVGVGRCSSDVLSRNDT